jgi:hypothetical protein
LLTFECTYIYIHFQVHNSESHRRTTLAVTSPHSKAKLNIGGCRPKGAQARRVRARSTPATAAVIALTAASTDIARRNLATLIPDGPWLGWASRLIPALTIEAAIAWLDAGQPDPWQAASRIGQAIGGVIQAAQPSDS